MSKNNNLDKFLSLFSDDIIRKRKSSVEFDNSGSINTSAKASGNHFEMFNKIHIKKETNNLDNKVLLDKQLFKTTVFKNDWNKTQWKVPNNCQNSKLLINQSSPKRNKYTQESELSDKLTFPTLFSSPERKPSKIIIDNNNSQNQSGPTILSYFKERKKIVNTENQCTPRKNGIENTHKSWNNRIWSQFSITKKKSPNFGKPKPSEGILQPSNAQTFKHLTPAKCTPNAKEKTRKSLDLKRLVGSKFSEKMVQNRQRQRGIENYLESFCDPQRVESKNYLKSSQVSTNCMDLKPSVSQQSCKETQKVYKKFEESFLKPSNTISKTTRQTKQYSDIELFQGSFRKYNSLDYQKSLSQASNSWLNKPPSWLTPPNSGSERKKGSNNPPFSEGFDECLDNLKTQLNSNELTQSLLEQLGPDISHLIKEFTKENHEPKEKILNFNFKEPSPINIITDYQITSPNTVSNNGAKLTEKTVSENLESNEEEIIDIQQTILSSAFTQTIPESCTQDVIDLEKPTGANNPTETQNKNTDTLKRKRSKHPEKTTKQQKLESTLESTPNTLTQNIQSSDVNLESSVVKTFKGYNLKKDSILYGDNLLKELLSDRNVIVKAYEKNMSKRKVEQKSEDILTKTCIKRYRKGNMKIYAIRKRYKACKRKKQFEHTFIETLQKRVKNNFEETSSSEDDDCRTVSTPCSYLTDDGKSDALSTKTQLTEYKHIIRNNIDKLRKDENLIFSSFLDPAPKETDSSEILATVHRIILQVLGDYSAGLRPYFSFPANINNNCVFNNNMYQLRANPVITKVIYTEKTCVRFNVMLFILNKIRLLLETSTKLTKRELFYLLKTMVKDQNTTNNAIRNISKMIGVGCWDLNVTAQKGLVYGDLHLITANGETINCNVPGTLIPIDINTISEVHSNAYFILVVEKESIFHKLLEEDLPNRLPRPFILITGKGFPDLGTQLFLKKLWMLMSIPVFIMVDADPDGISIMLTYRFGSMSSAHLCDYLAIPKAKWLGIFPSEIEKLNGDSNNLTKTERKKVARLLDLECVQSNQQIKQEVEILQDSGTKMGIEGLIKSQTYLSQRYLTSKFIQNDLI